MEKEEIIKEAIIEIWLLVDRYTASTGFANRELIIERGTRKIVNDIIDETIIVLQKRQKKIYPSETEVI